MFEWIPGIPLPKGYLRYRELGVISQDLPSSVLYRDPRVYRIRFLLHLVLRPMLLLLFAEIRHEMKLHMVQVQDHEPFPRVVWQHASLIKTSSREANPPRMKE